MTLRLTSPKTLPILIEALTRITFRQKELALATKTSAGRVNAVVKWLEEKGYATKTKEGYHIQQPNRLAEAIASQQTIKKQQTFQVLENKQTITKKIKTSLILGSRVEIHTKKETQNNIEALSSDDVINYLKQLPRGEQQVTIYETDNTNTDIVSTIIGLKALGRNTEQLGLELWGTRQ